MLVEKSDLHSGIQHSETFLNLDLSLCHIAIGRHYNLSKLLTDYSISTVDLQRLHGHH